MELIEQAVFTSAETPHASGYHVVAASPGAAAADLRELAAWCPSHDSLVDPSPAGASVNFHPLPSGVSAISRTTAAGWEYSGRGGLRIYTQCFLVKPATLERFANNPFPLLCALRANGSLRVYDDVPGELPAIRLPGRAAAFDEELTTRVATSLGAEWLAGLVQAVLGSVTLAVAAGPPAEHLVAAIVNLLPPKCRTELSFSTGLKFSSRRPFRLVALGNDLDERRRVRRVYNLHVLDLSGPLPEDLVLIDSWPRLIRRVVRGDHWRWLAAKLAEAHGDLAIDDLPALGLQWLEDLDSIAPEAEPLLAEPSQNEPGQNEHCQNERCQAPPESDLAQPPLPGAGSDGPYPDVLRRHEGAHGRFGKSVGATRRSDVVPPSQTLEPSDPAVLERLERLDDLVYDALAGSDTALAELHVYWPEIRDEFDDSLLSESREQYLRYALSLWHEFAAAAENRDVSRAVEALEVLHLLFV